LTPKSVLDQVAHDFAVLFRGIHTNGVWDVEGGGTGLDDLAQDFTEKVLITPSRILGRELNVLTLCFGILHSSDGALHAFLARNAELVLEVNVRGGQESVDATARRTLNRLVRTINVFLGCASKGSNNLALEFGGD
jgi:hypothetical protein